MPIVDTFFVCFQQGFRSVFQISFIDVVNTMLVAYTARRMVVHITLPLTVVIWEVSSYHPFLYGDKSTVFFLNNEVIYMAATNPRLKATSMHYKHTSLETNNRCC